MRFRPLSALLLVQSAALCAALIPAMRSAAQPPPAGQPPASPASAADSSLPTEWVKKMQWRSIGPAAMGGRITDFAVYEADPNIYWVATASGGLLKTTNNGVTFEHQFDHESTVSIGDVCVAPSDPKIVWVGTGENNPRNSVSFGDGVYKSVDGGKTWKHMGLKETYQIGRIVIDPKDPNIVYVGALGRLYGHNKERGLYKTTDGGTTWEKVLYVNDKTGVIDVAMSPADPNTLLVSMWERQRDGFDSFRGDPPLEDGYDAYDPIKKWGLGSGLYKTTDGGKSFRKLTAGLPSNNLGRVGLDFYRKSPNTVFAIIDCQKIGMGTPPSRVYMGIFSEDAQGADPAAEPGARITQITDGGPAAKAGLKAGDVITAVDGQKLTSSDALTAIIRTRKAGDKLALTVKRDGQTQEITVTLEDRSQFGAPGTGRVSLPLLLGAVTDDVEIGEPKTGGVKLVRLLQERAAEKAGFKENDVITEAEKQPVKNSQELLALLQKAKPGDKIAVTVQRDGKPKKLELKLDEGSISGPGGATRTRPWSFMYGGQQPNIQDQQGPNSHEYGGIYRSDDAGDSWTRINSLNPRPMYFSQVRVDPSDDKFLYVLGVDMYRSSDGGKTFKDDGANRVHPDQHALWIDPRDGRHMLVGCDGGYYASYDRMATWDHLNHMAIGQFYHVALDSKTPYRVYGGLQDNGSWGGPSQGLTGVGPMNEDWIVVGGGDGFVCRVDPFDPDLVYWESQDGSIGRRNLRTGERGSIRPRPVRGKSFRFNWNSPFILSSHNPGILYSGGNYVFRSIKRGEDLKIISPEIARTGRGTATAIAESPRNADVLWAGTDDGNLWVTQDGGEKWTNVAEKVGLKEHRWVATIECSRFADGRCYVAFDGHRADDDEPYVYVTEDFGQTWKSIRANLPVGSTRCLREDVKNPSLLFCGTEFAAFASINRGASWTKLNSNLPTVAVHELAIHPTAGEMVAATHGRSLWVLDITALRQMTATAMAAPAALFEPNTVTRWRSEPARSSPYGTGFRHFVGDNPPRGAQIYLNLKQKAMAVKLAVYDYAGALVRELPVKNEPGLQVVPWDLSRTPRQRPAGGPGGGGTGGGAGGGGGRGGGGGGFGFGGFGAPVAAGTYKLVLTVDGTDYPQPLRIENDPTLPPGVSPSEDPEDEEDREREERRGAGRRIDQ